MKERRLRDWEKLKKYVIVQKQGKILNNLIKLCCACLCALSNVQLCVEKCEHPPPKTHTFLKRPFPTDFKKYTHTPPYVVTCLHIGAKLVKNAKKKKWQNAQSWHTMNEAERNGDKHEPEKFEMLSCSRGRPSVWHFLHAFHNLSTELATCLGVSCSQTKGAEGGK